MEGRGGGNEQIPIYLVKFMYIPSMI